MTAGTVVITGGILATAILLCIIVVLCYCRLQYYCCKKSGFDADGACPQPQYACSVCSSPTPEPTPPQSFCPTCTPYSSTFYIRTLDEGGNGGERIVYRPACYDSPPYLAVPTVPTRPMSCHAHCSPPAISTDV